MKVAFRVDASESIGIGHVMRCFNLALNLKKKNKAIIYFVYSTISSNIKKKLILNNIKLLKINHNYSFKNIEKNWDKKKQIEDAKQTINKLKKKNISLLILDNYKLNYIWEGKIKKIVKKICVIDDLFKTKHNCDIILNQNFVLKKSLTNYFRQNTKLLIGPKFAIINKKIKRNLKFKTRKEITVFFGGKFESKLIDIILSFFKLKNISENINIIAMKNFKKFKLLKKKYYNTHNFKFLVLPKNYPNLLNKTKLFIGAGGSSIFERLYSGVPNFIFCMSNNQKNNCLFLKKRKIIFMKSININLNIDYFYKNIMNILSNKKLMMNKLQKGILCVDGKGVDRITNLITAK